MFMTVIHIEIAMYTVSSIGCVLTIYYFSPFLTLFSKSL